MSPSLQVDSPLDPPRGPLQIPIASHPTLTLSLVIPTYNERHSLHQLIEQLVDHLNRHDHGRYLDRYELIVVDDDSPDGTWEAAQKLMETYAQLRVIRRQSERGLATAVVRGWQASHGAFLGVMDSDLQHPPQTLCQLLDSLETSGGDIAVASRHIDGGGVSEWSLRRRMLSRGAQLLGLLLLPETVGAVSDPMSGYFVVQRRAIANIHFNPLGYKILLEVLGRGRIQAITEVGYVFQERLQGDSKVSASSYIDYVLHLLRLRMSRRGDGLNHNLLRKNGGRFLRFALVGFSGLFVDMLMLYLLSDPTTLAWGLTGSKILASEVAIANNFFWNDRWTFSDLVQGQRSIPQRLKRFIKFNLICLFGLLLNLLILNLLFNQFGVDRYLANLIAIACVTLWNFWMNLKLGWRSTNV